MRFHFQVDRAALTENVVQLSGKSQMIRERLHGRNSVESQNVIHLCSYSCEIVKKCCQISLSMKTI